MLLAFAALVALVLLARGTNRCLGPLLGMGLVASYAAIRMISFDIVDLRIFLDGTNVTWLLEVTGLLMIIVTALLPPERRRQ